MVRGFSSEELLITPVELVSRLGKKIDELWETLPPGQDTPWTLSLKKHLQAIGNEVASNQANLTVQTIYTKAEAGVGEFLLDLIWWCRATDSPKEYMGLAVEIEWDSVPTVAHAVGVDFSKLTVVKCPLKLMVFATQKRRGHAEMQRAVLTETERYISLCSSHSG